MVSFFHCLNLIYLKKASIIKSQIRQATIMPARKPLNELAKHLPKQILYLDGFSVVFINWLEIGPNFLLLVIQ